MEFSYIHLIINIFMKITLIHTCPIKSGLRELCASMQSMHRIETTMANTSKGIILSKFISFTFFHIVFITSVLIVIFHYCYSHSRIPTHLKSLIHVFFTLKISSSDGIFKPICSNPSFFIFFLLFFIYVQGLTRLT